MNYDKMPAGPKMDALVAEQVMGCRYIADYCRWELPSGRWSTEPPSYSTDIAAAWEVVEHISPDLAISVARLPDMDYSVLIYGHTRETVGFSVEVYADTAPLAICRAALKAVA